MGKNSKVGFETKLKQKKHIPCKNCEYNSTIINDGIMKDKNYDINKDIKRNEKINKKIDYLNKYHKSYKLDKTKSIAKLVLPKKNIKTISNSINSNIIKSEKKQTSSTYNFILIIALISIIIINLTFMASLNKSLNYFFKIPFLQYSLINKVKDVSEYKGKLKKITDIISSLKNKIKPEIQ